MIIKLIFFIASIVALAFFTGFNLDNKCNIWFFWKSFENVPVFMNSLISFALGILCALPFAFVRRSRKAKEIEKKEKDAVKKAEEKNVSEEDKKEKKVNSKRESILNKIQNLKKQNDSNNAQNENN